MELFVDQVPYCVALVETIEGPRILTNIMDTDESSLQIGALVEVAFLKVSEDCALPVFALGPKA